MQKLIDVLRSHGIAIVPDFTTDYQRNEHQWIFKSIVGVAGRVVPWAVFGDFKLRNKIYWLGAELSPEEVKEAEEKIAASQKEYQKKKEAGYGAVADDAKRFIQGSCTPKGVTPYMVQKGVVETHGAYVYEDMLIIPFQDIDENIWSYQTIFASGNKQYQYGGKKKGCFFAFNPTSEFKPGENIYVCEGYSTGNSIFEALHRGSTVVAAGDAGNLETVGRALRERYPHATLYFCADNDCHGTGINTGIERAFAAVREVGSGCELRYPVFTDLTTKPTDFNDLHLLLGLDEVRKQLNEPRSDAKDTPKELTPIEPTFSKNGKPLKILHKQVVDRLLQHYADKFVKQGRDLFYYAGTHWVYCDEAMKDELKTQLLFVHGNDSTAPSVEAMYTMFLWYVKPAGRDMFIAAPWMANFQNGTLKATPMGSGFTLSFHEHRMDDYLVNVLPFKYDAGWKDKPYRDLNPEFSAMLDRIFEGDTDKDDKIKALEEMFGACLMPTYPHLFMLYGPSATGKSTVMKLAARLVDEANISNVEPHLFEGFYMEPMAGKLVNMDTDITLTKPLSDSVLKKIEDRTKIQINRKHAKAIKVTFPAVHIFGGNDIPRTTEGVSQAHDRRWTFLEFRCRVTKGKYNKDFVEACFDAGPQGIIAFAMTGLSRLLTEGGHFTVPASGRDKMESWQLEADPVGQFLEDARSGEALDQLDKESKVYLREHGAVERTLLYDCFVEWTKRTGVSKSWNPSRKQFYRLLRNKGYQDYEGNIGWLFKGIGVAPHGKSHH